MLVNTAGFFKHEHLVTPQMSFGDSNPEPFQHVHPLAPYLSPFKEISKKMSGILIYLLMNLLKSRFPQILCSNHLKTSNSSYIINSKYLFILDVYVTPINLYTFTQSLLLNVSIDQLETS